MVRQFHQTPEMKEKAKSLGLTHLDFDGCSEIWVKSWEDWEKFYKVRLNYAFHAFYLYWQEPITESRIREGISPRLLLFHGEIQMNTAVTKNAKLWDRQCPYTSPWVTTISYLARRFRTWAVKMEWPRRMCKADSVLHGNLNFGLTFNRFVPFETKVEVETWLSQYIYCTEG